MCPQGPRARCLIHPPCWALSGCKRATTPPRLKLGKTRYGREEIQLLWWLWHSSTSSVAAHEGFWRVCERCWARVLQGQGKAARWHGRGTKWRPRPWGASLAEINVKWTSRVPKFKTIPSIDCFNGEAGMASCCNLRGNSNILQAISGEGSVSCRSKVSLGTPLFSGQKGAVMFRVWQFAAQKSCWWSNPRVSAVQWLTF